MTIGHASPVSMLVLTKPLDHGMKAVMNTSRAAVHTDPSNTIALDHEEKIGVLAGWTRLCGKGC